MVPCWLLVLIIFTVQRTLAVPGALVWKSANNSCAITTAPIIFNQLTVVGDACGNLRGFDAAGKLKYSVSAYSNITSVLVLSEVALIAGTASGKLIAYFSALHHQPTVTVDVTSGSIITALINTPNDLIAVGAIQYLTAHNINVPSQVSIVGYNGMPFAEMLSPALTTVTIPAEQMGQQAARLLLNAIEDQEVPKQKVLLAPKLEVRASTAPPPHA